LKLPIPIPSLSGLLGRFRKRGGGDPEDQDPLGDDLGDDLGEEIGDETALSSDAEPDDENPGGMPLGDDLDDDAPAGKPKRRWARVAAIVSGVLGVLLILGGLGAIVGWLVVNAEHAIKAREALHPTISVDVLAEGEPAPKNSSRDASQPPMTAEGGSETAEAMAERPNEAGDAPPSNPLAGVVDPALVEQTDDGPLPSISGDGRQAWVEYSAPFDKTDRRPRLAIIVANLGLSPGTTEAVMDALPPEVTLSFSSIAPDLQDWVARARRKGHEVLIDLPMEPDGFPRSDPGRNTLLTSASEVENLNRLEGVMKRAGGYVGLLTTMGSAFTVNADSLAPVLQTLKERGLLYVDGRYTSRTMCPELASQIQLPRAYNNRFIDTTPSLRAINGRLTELEEITKINRFAVGLAQPYPVTLDRLTAWLPTLKAKGIALAPITAIADKQSLR
jgi:polysaccharide deacetylase 2 family uncharacterized protein YibQ